MRPSRASWRWSSLSGRAAARPASLAGIGLLVAAALVACGDDSVENPSTTASSAAVQSSSAAGPTSTASGGPTSTGNGGEGQGGNGQGGNGQGGGTGGQGGGEGGSPPSVLCDVVASGPTRGSAIAISKNDETLVSVNRDVGTVTVTRVAYDGDGAHLSKVTELDLGEGSEPWQVAIDACGERAYVVLRKDQQVVEILDLDTDEPTVGARVSVGSEPTGIAIGPGNTRLYVANWVEGTVNVISTTTMQHLDPIDLNGALADTGLLGDVAGRPALAHPRAIAITNDGDLEDDDEQVIVTEWYGQRFAPESSDGKNSDTNKKGLVYVIDAGSGSVDTIDLPPIQDVGINNRLSQVTGCYPNQVGSVTIEGGFAYVTSVCASPVGPLGVFTPAPPIPCTVATQATDCAAVGTNGTITCNPNTLQCNPNPQDAKTTTHPVMHVVDLTSQTAVGTPLDTAFSAPEVASARMPLLPSDVGFFNGFAYVAASGADAVFRVSTDAGELTEFGSDANDFINLRKDANDILIRLPIGIATANGADAFAFVANDGSRDVTALALGTQSIVGLPDAPEILQAADLPVAGSDADDVLRGKRFFSTGLGRWSLAGAAWGACAACHIDGLSDNVTWYFNRGPRQSTSLDGTFNSSDGSDQRVLNWTAIFDEVADFELNTRGVSGGLGAIVGPDASTRINLATQTPPQLGLQGSTRDIADPEGGTTTPDTHAHSVLPDFLEIEAWIKTIRSPRAPVGLDQDDVDDGRVIFESAGQGNCKGCHAGGKWTISTRFYPVGDAANPADGVILAPSLEGQLWPTNSGLPASLLPASSTQIGLGNNKMRFGTFPASEQIQCILRPVGTFEISDPAVNVRELRNDMSTRGQGDAESGLGFNPPALLGTQVGAPFFHAGNARTLEELFDQRFEGHHKSAIANVFDPEANDNKRKLVAFLLSIDEDSEVIDIPGLGAAGGDLCSYTP